MSRRPPAGNGVVGHDERDDPGRVPGGGALAGAPGRAGLGALDGPADGAVVESAAARPVLAHLGEDGTNRPDRRLPAREDPDDAAAAPGLAVGAPLRVAGAQPDVMLVWEVQVCERICLGLPQDRRRFGAEPFYLADGQLVKLAHCCMDAIWIASGGRG